MPGAKSHFSAWCERSRAGSRRRGMHRRKSSPSLKEYPVRTARPGCRRRNRFRNRGRQSGRSFLQAEVLMIVDEPGAAPQEDTSRRRSVALRTASHCRRQTRSLRPPTLRLLSLYLAGSLPSIWISNRSYSLCAPKPKDFPLLITYLQTLIPNLHRAARARKKPAATDTCGRRGASGSGFGFRAPGFGQEPN